MTLEEWQKKFFTIAPGIPAINQGEVPILLHNNKAYIPSRPLCEEFATEEEAKKAYPALQYITVKSG